MIQFDPKQQKRKQLKDKALTILVWGFTFSCLLVVFIILFYLVKMGVSSLNWALFSQNPKPVGENGGGLLNAIVGSLLVVGVADFIAIPLGITAGIYLAENRGRKLADRIALAVDVLQGIPSIVVGIVIYIWIVKPTGKFSSLSGSVALAIMMMPPIIKNTEETLILIPRALKEASLALGASYYHTIMKIILPAGMGGIFTGCIIGIARIFGEVAPLLFTAFGNPALNFNILKPVDTIPKVIFTYASSPYDEWHRIAWGGSLILVTFIILLNMVIKLFERKWRVQF